MARFTDVIAEAIASGFRYVDDGADTWDIDLFRDEVAEETEGDFSPAYDPARSSYDRIRIDEIGSDGYRRPTPYWIVR